MGARGRLGAPARGYAAFVETAAFDVDELSEAWVEGDPAARWRSATGHRGDHGGSSLLEVGPGCRLPRHTDSAEEAIVVVAGRALVRVGDEEAVVAAGGVALVPECVVHEVRNASPDEPLRFVALYTGTDVVTTYEQPVEPGGERERRPLG